MGCVSCKQRVACQFVHLTNVFPFQEKPNIYVTDITAYEQNHRECLTEGHSSSDVLAGIQVHYSNNDGEYLLIGNL